MPGLNKSFQWNLVLVIGWFGEVVNEQQAGNLAKNCACCVNSIVSNVLIYQFVMYIKCVLLSQPPHTSVTPPWSLSWSFQESWPPPMVSTVPRNIDHTPWDTCAQVFIYKSVFLETLSPFLGQQWYGGSGQNHFIFPGDYFGSLYVIVNIDKIIFHTPF